MAVFLVLCIIYLYHAYFISSSLYLLIPFLHLVSPLPISLPVITSLSSVSVCLFLFCYSHSFVLFFRFHLQVRAYNICLSLIYFTKLDTLPSIHVVADWSSVLCCVLIWLKGQGRSLGSLS